VRALLLPVPVLLAALAPLPADATEGAVVKVQTLAGAFSPEAVEVRPGDLVTFRNVDGRAHTVTSAWDGGAAFHRVLKPGESFTVRFDASGTYAIRCVPHSAEDGHGGHDGMVTEVRVAAPAAAPEAPASRGSGGTVLLGLLGAAILVLAALWLRNGGARGTPPAPTPRARPTSPAPASRRPGIPRSRRGRPSGAP
jgi:plastocyanin